MSTTQTIHDVARRIYDASVSEKRGDGSPWIHTREGTSDEVRQEFFDVVYRAGSSEDDVSADMARDALAFILDNPDEDLDDAAHKFADGAISAYTASLTAWLASSIHRVGLCDEAANELGDAECMTDAIGRGWYWEARDIFADVVRALNDIAEA